MNGKGSVLSMTRFYILRHGETQWNHQGNKYCGISDIPLNDTGKMQALQAAAALKQTSFAAVYCSPLQRSRETGQIIGKILHATPIADERVREIDFGAWEGKTRQEIELEYAEEWNEWLQNPGTTPAGVTGESANEVWLRYHSFIKDKSFEHAGESVLVVGHNTSNRMLFAGSLELPFNKYRSFVQHNAGISVLESEQDELRWIHINLTANNHSPL
ncbi:histidine phosphatase family protein [Paenibacillus sp. sptzw28]|uniref:histidine phosphatase family protein n=1 Tax=Paenibacillus sp. sptzw28 TaxID=715179 RepID=UPI001C6F2DF5|nr:histidine phosphatase family protein [Paenibacillus sp. sptzw28]QYR21789.1 histidine phosphatase family protein [Paenibacillus sp. sptzw28]